MALFRIARPLFRPHNIPSLHHARITPSFFASPKPTVGLRNVTPHFSIAQAISRRTYSNEPRQKPAQIDYDALEAEIDKEYAGQTKTKTHMTYAIIGLCVGIYGYKEYLKMEARQTGDVSRFRAFMENFSVSLHGVVDEHRYWQVLTSMFNHSSLTHIGFNMLTFYYMGGLLTQAWFVTPASFLTVCLASGLVGNLGWMYDRWTRAQKEGRSTDYTHALGFSGTVSGLVAASAVLFPKARIHLMGVIPMPLWLAAGLGMVYDGYFVDSSARTGVAHVGHLGGAFTGLVVSLLYWRVARARFNQSLMPKFQARQAPPVTPVPSVPKASPIRRRTQPAKKK